MSKSSAKATEFLVIAIIGVLLLFGPSLLGLDLGLFGKYLTYAILAISVDLLWGYTGLLSLGQALFFSLGGYMLGMHLMLMIGKLGQYKSDLPDFMVFLGHQFLPWFWKPFYSFPFAMLMVVLLPALLALVFGWLAFRSRVKGVYFSILTQALTYVAVIVFYQNSLIMGGSNGFTDFKSILGANIASPGTVKTLYAVTVVTLIAIYLGCRWLTTSRFGLIQRAIRDSETRVLFSGYPVARFKLFIFVISSIIASLGGALYVTQVRIINPSLMEPAVSLEAVVWVAVGGRGTLFGPILGAIAVNFLKSWATRAYPDLWPLFLGGTFILVVLFMPKGLVGLPGQLKALFARRTSEDDAAPTAPAPITPPAAKAAELPPPGAGASTEAAPATAAQS